MFVIITKMFFLLLTSIVSASNHTKSVSSSNQKRMRQPILISLHPNEYRQDLHCSPFVINLDRCAESCNTLMTYLIKHVFQIRQKI